MKIVIIGCGYLGRRCAERWLASGHEVVALTRSQQTAESFRQAGLSPRIGDVLQPETLQNLPEADLCLYAVGYDRRSSADKRSIYVDGLKNVLHAISGRIPRLIYVSSTSVYGQDHGEVVDEESLCEPTEENGKICRDAENLIRELQHERHDQSAVFRSAVILRLAGIYGPDRLIARLDQLRQQIPIAGNPDGWLNLIHVDDAVSAIDILSNKSQPKLKTYLLSDGHPLPRREFYKALANRIQAPDPVFAAEQTATPTTGRLNKRCNPSQTLLELELTLTHPHSTSSITLESPNQGSNPQT